jgi:hypothetical protein
LTLDLRSPVICVTPSPCLFFQAEFEPEQHPDGFILSCRCIACHLLHHVAAWTPDFGYVLCRLSLTQSSTLTASSCPAASLLRAISYSLLLR